MTKTVRINFMVSPEEKADIDARAKKASLTTSELVRRAVVAYDPDHEIAELTTLAEELAQAAERMVSKLAATQAKVACYEAALADREGLKAAARAELEASGVVWPFDLTGTDRAQRPTT